MNSADLSAPKKVLQRPLLILFVEDNPADVDLCLRTLKKADLEVRADVVTTREEFEERMSASSFDIIVSDYKLPGWTGLDALDMLRKEGRDIPFILMTGTLGEETAVDCIKKGASDYVLKDRMTRLPVAINRAVEEKYMRDERRWTEAALRASELRFRTLTEVIGSAVFIYRGPQLCYVNNAAEALTGYSRNELLTMNFWDIVHPDFREIVRERGLAHQREERPLARHAIKILTIDGGTRWLDVTVGTIDLDGAPAGLVTAFDITEYMRLKGMVHSMTLTDPLTGLFNSDRLNEVLDVEIKRSQRTKRPFSTLLLDLDGLKQINNSSGHLVGSRALCRLAHVLRAYSRAIDTAARYRDDEFALVLPEAGASGAEVVARRIADRLANDGEQPELSVSIGTAVCPQDGETPQTLLQSARHALDKARNRRPLGIETGPPCLR